MGYERSLQTVQLTRDVKTTRDITTCLTNSTRNLHDYFIRASAFTFFRLTIFNKHASTGKL